MFRLLLQVFDNQYHFVRWRERCRKMNFLFINYLSVRGCSRVFVGVLGVFGHRSRAFGLCSGFEINRGFGLPTKKRAAMGIKPIAMVWKDQYFMLITFALLVKVA
jgi:hypothetical protein